MLLRGHPGFESRRLRQRLFRPVLNIRRLSAIARDTTLTLQSAPRFIVLPLRPEPILLDRVSPQGQQGTRDGNHQTTDRQAGPRRCRLHPDRRTAGRELQADRIGVVLAGQ
ncbi:hypothetical protein NOVOSPHI9U_780026 [Novosphingobium sp. 9U]|nr:hypothetical protein NOVOSPHI9U_780026 [Novosphingobium sp. 9U]